MGQANTPEKEELRRQNISNTMKRNGKAGGIREGSGRGQKGWYKGYFCDSTYELVYVIYNIDHNINFERNTTGYEYIYLGQSHKYFPDFILEDGSYVEIKGYYTQLVDIKVQSVTDKEIKVLYKKDLDYAFKWVQDNYTYKNLYDLYDQCKRDYTKRKKNRKPKPISKYKIELQQKKKENEYKRQQLITEGKIDKSGRVTCRVFSKSEWEQRETLILNSGVDLTKYGWQEKVSQVTGLTSRMIHGTIKHTDKLKEQAFMRS